jgi:hypothetical protein
LIHRATTYILFLVLSRLSTGEFEPELTFYRGGPLVVVASDQADPILVAGFCRVLRVRGE